jgi:hypothetical protein
MPKAITKGTAVVALLVAAALLYLWFTPLDDQRAMRLTTIVIAAVTAIYALITYEILTHNRAMAEASMRSAHLMEQSLRFSFAPNLLFLTVNTKDPTFAERPGWNPIRNEDYDRALREYVGSGQQREFVFAAVRNVGRGPATRMTIEATYQIRDTANPNQTFTRTQNATVQLVEPNRAVALFVYVSRAPTPDDRVTLVSARITSSDSYRDALSEAPVQQEINPQRHTVEADEHCVIRMT